MTATTASPAQWRGHDLGTRTIAYDERDAILYALAVGASATDLDLVFEERLRVLPTFALTLAQWAPDALGALGPGLVLAVVHLAAERLLRNATGQRRHRDEREADSAKMLHGVGSCLKVRVVSPLIVRKMRTSSLRRFVTSLTKMASNLPECGDASHAFTR